MDFKKLQLEKAEEIDNILRRYLPEPAGGQAACMEDMAYGVLGGGKRLRPMLMRETCALFAEDTSAAEPFMAAIEMIHTYSLIHDDIMDNDDERRGRPTIHARYRAEYMEKCRTEAAQAGECSRKEAQAGGSSRKAAQVGESSQEETRAGEGGREAVAVSMSENDMEDVRKTAEEAKKFGESMGILAGDALLTHAFGIMADAAGKDLSRAAAGIRAMSLIAKKAGVYGMVGGQVIDVQNVGTDMTADQVKNINELKTSALIEASMMAGAILGGADDTSVRRIERAASLIGQAFQIEDDILDVTGNAEALGKPVGSDDRNDKNTYVRIYGLAECRRMVAELSEEAIRVLKGCDFAREPDGLLEELLRSLVNRDH